MLGNCQPVQLRLHTNNRPTERSSHAQRCSTSRQVRHKRRKWPPIALPYEPPPHVSHVRSFRRDSLILRHVGAASRSQREARHRDPMSLPWLEFIAWTRGRCGSACRSTVSLSIGMPGHAPDKSIRAICASKSDLFVMAHTLTAAHVRCRSEGSDVFVQTDAPSHFRLQLRIVCH